MSHVCRSLISLWHGRNYVLFPQLRSVVSAVALFWDLKSARCKATCFKSVAVGCNVLTSPMVVPMCGMLQCVLLHVALG